MKIENNIGWCDATGNMVIGCRGCELAHDGTCYAMHDTPARVLRAGGWPGHKGQKIETFGPNSQRVPTKKGLSDLRRLNKLCVCDYCAEANPVAGIVLGRRCVACNSPRLRRIRYFADSNSDWLDWPTEQLAQGLDAIRRAPNVTTILLTKWPELWFSKMKAAQRSAKSNDMLYGWITLWLSGYEPPHVWILTSILGNELDAKRVSNLLKIPAAVRGVSCEPLRASVNLRGCVGLSWAIVGCDSSPRRIGWETYENNAMRLIYDCRENGVPVYHKQMPVNGRVSLKPEEWPEWARIRQFPQ